MNNMNNPENNGDHDHSENCAAETAIQNMSGKWTVRIMMELLESPKRPCQLYKALPGISSKVLNQRLKHLRDIGVINQINKSDRTLHTEYQLTELGKSFENVITELEDFGKKMEASSTERMIQTGK